MLSSYWPCQLDRRHSTMSGRLRELNQECKLAMACVLSKARCMGKALIDCRT